MGNDLYLIQIEGLDEATKRQEEIDYIVFKTVLRNALSELTIELKYSDIYEKNFYTEVRKLDWFARTLKE